MQRALPLHYTFRAVVPDHHIAARTYFLSVLGLLVVEAAIRLPPWIQSLRKTQNANPPSKRLPPTVLLHKLLTHPSPLPFLTSHPISTIFRLTIFISLNLLFSWTRLRFTTDFQRFGYMALANGGLALLLPTRHANFFSTLLQIPSPVLLGYHHWAGLASFIHATAHFSLTAQRYIHSEQFSVVLENARIRVGIFAWICLALVFLTAALPILRRKGFEVFFFTHFLFLGFVAGGFYHVFSTDSTTETTDNTAGFEFFFPGLGLWVIDRLWRAWDNFGRGKKVLVKKVRFYGTGLTKIWFVGVKIPRPGMMVWVQIPNVSKWNWHPFTVLASSPDEEQGGMIAVRGLGGFTKRVQLMDGEHEAGVEKDGRTENTFKIRLDGPYGVGNPRWTLTPVVVLVAGGIGITPGISIASHIVHEAARLGSSGSKRQVYLLWAVSHLSHARWFESELKALAEVASRDDVLVSLNITIHVTNRGKTASQEEHIQGIAETKTETDGRYMGPGEIHTGRPDILQWFQQVRELTGASDVAVNACGPQSLKDDARKAAVRVSSGKGLFFVHEEVFEL